MQYQSGSDSSAPSPTSSLAAQCSRKANQLLRYFVHPFFNFLVDQLFPVEGVARGIDKPRNNDGAEIKHQAVGISHNRHVAVHSAGCAQKSDNLVFPGAAGELNHVFGGGADIIIVNRRRDYDSVSRLDRFL